MIATDNAEMKNDKVSIGDIPAQNSKINNFNSTHS